MDLRLFQLPQTVVKHLGELCVRCLRTVRRASAPWQRRGTCLRLQTVRSDWAGMVLSGLNLAEIKKPFAAFVQLVLHGNWTKFVKSKPVCKSSSVKNMWLCFFEKTLHSQWQVWAQEKLGDEFVLNIQLLIYSGCYAAKQTAIMKPKVQLPFWLKKNDVGFFPRSIRYNCGFALCKSNSHGIKTVQSGRCICPLKSWSSSKVALTNSGGRDS